MDKQKRILIVRPDRIGDVVLSTAIPREIKTAFPNSFVSVLLRKYTQDIFFNNPFVDEILLLENLDGEGIKKFFESALKIRSYKFTHALMLLPNERINYMLFFAGIKSRIGVGRKFYQFITFTKEVSREKYIPLRHEADYCMDLARKIGFETENFIPEIHLSDEEKRLLKDRKSKFVDDGKLLVGVHTTSGNSAPNLKENRYYKLILELLKNSKIEVAVTDNIIPQSIKKLKGIHFLNENKSLRNSITNFAMLDLIISASTGPMHICSALGVKTISLFCPLTACSPQLWGPLGNENRSIMPHDDYCQKQCPGDPKKCEFEGSSRVDIERIISELTQFIL